MSDGRVLNFMVCFDGSFLKCENLSIHEIIQKRNLTKIGSNGTDGIPEVRSVLNISTLLQYSGVNSKTTFPETV